MFYSTPIVYTFKLKAPISKRTWRKIAGMEKWEYTEFTRHKKKKRASKRRKRHGETV